MNAIQLHCDVWVVVVVVVVDRKRQLLYFLISKSLPKRFRNIDFLKSTTAVELTKKLERHMAPLQQVGHEVQLIAFDGEKAIDCKDTEMMVQKLKARLDVNAGTHIGMIEN